MSPKQKKQIEKEIEQSYYRQANGRLISVLKIGALFTDAMMHHVEGKTIDEAVKLAINCHCEQETVANYVAEGLGEF